MKYPVQAVILAGGKGKRMGQAEIPKVLHKLGRTPLIKHLLKTLSFFSWGARPVIVVGFLKEQVMQSLGRVKYVYAVQARQLGTAHAVKTALSKVTCENILVLCGDMPFMSKDSLRKLINLHTQNTSPLTMVTTKVPSFDGIYKSIEKYGRIIRNKQGDIVAIREYKDATPKERKILEVNPGIYVFDTKWLKRNIKKIKKQNAQKEYYLTDMVELSIASSNKVASIQVKADELLGVNTQEDLEIARKVKKR